MEIDENRILFIGYEVYTRSIYSSVMDFIKIGLFNNINKKEISIKIKLPLFSMQQSKMGKNFKFRNGGIHYRDQGRGMVIVLVHGHLETSEIWSSFAGKLAEKFRVISVDLPGHGKSDIFGEVHTLEFMATVLRDLIGSLGIEKIFMTGHSMGGYVTMAFVDIYPDLLAGYCLFHSHPLADSAEVVMKRKLDINTVRAGGKNKLIPVSIPKMFANSNLQTFPDALHRSMKIASSVPADGIIAALKGMMARPSRLRVMEEGRVPCLWLLGAMDNYIDCQQIQTKVKLPGNAEVHILNGSGHMGFIEEEERSLEIVAEFAGKLFV
jgi:pimeloyl-ACP methyl ester carboxylesterase